MYTFLARQPIFNAKYGVYGYELLYRDTEKNRTADVKDGNSATRRVLSDAITLFGLDSLTNSKPAFVNFTSDLILEDFPLLANPKDIVVELLEDIKVTPEIVEKVAKLKEMGYTIALDDYIGGENFDQLLPYVDILKVDFVLTDQAKQKAIAQIVGNSIILLAEKVETNEEYQWAKKAGYSLFQGFFFSHPNTFKKKVHNISTTTFAMLMSELSREDVDLAKCGKLIRTDTVLTYRLLQKMNTTEYLRKQKITNVDQALVMMGTDEFRRWLILVVARDNNATGSNELTRAAFVRGLMAEALILQSPRAAEHENAFLLGMFSLLDQILDESMEKLLDGIEIDGEVQDALLGKEENFYSKLLKFIVDYEHQENHVGLADLGIQVSQDELHMQYAKCVAQADTIFNDL